jgi:hypothetical protein
MYKLSNKEGKLVSIIKDDGSGVVFLIPISEDNTDYQEYLRWLAEGNTPEPADSE